MTGGPIEEVLRHFRIEEPDLFAHLRTCTAPFCTKVRRVFSELESLEYPLAQVQGTTEISVIPECSFCRVSMVYIRLLHGGHWECRNPGHAENFVKAVRVVNEGL